MKKLLKFKGLIKSLPIVGDVAGPILDDTKLSESGKVTKEELTPVIVRLIIFLGIVYMASKGLLSQSEVETAKEIIMP